MRNIRDLMLNQLKSLIINFHLINFLIVNFHNLEYLEVHNFMN